MGMVNNNIPRMSIWASIVFAGAPALLAYLAMWYIAPAIQTWTGQPFLVGYLVAWGCMEALIFFASLLAFRIEGNEFSWNSLKERYRINSPKRADLVWVAVTLVVMLGTYLALGFTARWLGNFSFFAPHPSFPPELMPGAEQDITPGVFMGMQLQGKWWVLIAYIIGWFFNIAGEEMWFRGFMLPRQELSHGKFAWLINGLCFNFFHIMWKWNLIALLPGSLFLSFATQRRKNTSVAIIVHGLLNISTAIAVAAGVAGWGAA
jgi:membrane protease YdiL (CAAX protease family)